MDALVAEKENNPAVIQKIIADDNNILHFHLSEGSVGIRVCKDCSEANSRTAEKAGEQIFEK